MSAEQKGSGDKLSWVEEYGEVKAPDTGVYARPMPPHLAEWLMGHCEPFASMDNPGPVYPQCDSVRDILPWWGNKPATTRREQQEINMRGVRQARAILEAAKNRAGESEQLGLPTGDSAA